MREVAAALTGLKLTKAYAYLGDVAEHKQCIPFRRFSGGVGRASQAKQFKATQGALLATRLVRMLMLILCMSYRSLAREVCALHPPPLKKR